MSDFSQKLTFDASQAIASLAQLSQSLSAASTAMNNFSKATSKFNKANIGQQLQGMSTAASGAATSATALGNATNSMTNSLGRVNNSAKNVASQMGAAGTAAKGTATQFTSLGGISTTLAGVLGGQLAFRAISAMISGFSEAIVSARDLSIAIGELQTIGGGQIGGIGKVTGEIQKIATAFNATLGEVAEGYYQTLSNQVVKAGEAFEFLAVAQNLATVTTSSTIAAVDTLSSIMNSYGDQADNVVDVSDKLMKSVELGRFRLEEIGNIMGRVTPIAAELGISFEEVLASVVVMTQQGVKANTAFTQLRAVMMQLIKPTENMKELFESWGVKDAEEAMAAFGGFAGVLRKLADETGGASSETGKYIHNVRALAGALGLNVEDGRKLAEVLDQIESATGSMGEALSKLDMSAGYQMHLQWQEFKNTLTSIATNFLPSIVMGLKAVNRGVQNFAKNIAGMLGIELQFESAESALEDLLKAQEEYARDKTWQNAEKERIKLFGESMKAGAAYARVFDTFPSAAKRATNEAVAAFNASTHAFYTGAAGIENALTDAFKNASEAAKKSFSDLRSTIQGGIDFKQAIEVASAPDDRKDKVRIDQLKKNLDKALQELREAARKGSGELYEEASAAVNKNLSELEGIAVKLKASHDKAGDSAIRAAESYRKKLEEAERQRATSAAALAKSLSTDAGAQAMAKQIQEKVAANKTLMDQIKKYTEGIGEMSAEEQKAAAEAIRKASEALETLTPQESAFVKKLGGEQAIELFRRGLEQMKANASIEWDTAIQNLRDQLADQVFKATLQLQIDEPDLAAKLNSALSDAKLRGVKIESGRPEDVKNALKASTEIVKEINESAKTFEKAADTLGKGISDATKAAETRKQTRQVLLDPEINAKVAANKLLGGQTFKQAIKNQFLGATLGTGAGFVSKLLSGPDASQAAMVGAANTLFKEANVEANKLEGVLDGMRQNAASGYLVNTDNLKEAETILGNMIKKGVYNPSLLEGYQNELAALKAIADAQKEINEFAPEDQKIPEYDKATKSANELRNELGKVEETTRSATNAGLELGEGFSEKLQESIRRARETKTEPIKVDVEADPTKLDAVNQSINNTNSSLDKAKAKAGELNTSLSNISVPGNVQQAIALMMLGATQSVDTLKTDLQNVNTVDITGPIGQFETEIQQAGTTISGFATTLSEAIGTALANGFSSLMTGGPIQTIKTSIDNVKPSVDSVSKAFGGWKVTNVTDLTTFKTKAEQAKTPVESLRQALQSIPDSMSATPEQFSKATQGTENLIDSILGLANAAVRVLVPALGTVNQDLGILPEAAQGISTAISAWPTAVSAIIPAIQQAIAAMNQLRAAAQAALAAAQAAAASGGAKARYGRYFASGGSSRGLDTIDAKLTKGEFVINAGATRKFYSELVAMNAGKQPAFRDQGGSVTNVGDINVNVHGQETSRQTIREIASGLRRELKRGTIKL